MKLTSQATRRRLLLLLLVMVLLPIALCVSIAVGAVPIELKEIVAILCGSGNDARYARIVLDIRLPQALAAIVAGGGLAISGAAMQGVLRNPLCTPFTLGISGAAAFGAALVLFIGGGEIAMIDNKFIAGFSSSLVTFGAFICASLATLAILLFSRLRGSRNETIILVGVALNSLFNAGLIFLQYLSNDTRLAAMVYWTFGDTARANWNGVILMTVCVMGVSLFFFFESWHYNALAFGEETAAGLGVNVRRVRTLTMLFASLLTAVVVSILGIIGFVGLIVPHIARLIIGHDSRFLLPFSLLFGALFLLVADTSARLLFAPRLLPVSILTAFIGVPVFLSLLLKRSSS